VIRDLPDHREHKVNKVPLVRKKVQVTKDPKGLPDKQDPQETPDLKEKKEIRDIQETQDLVV
jgi:hypothetical protein